MKLHPCRECGSTPEPMEDYLRGAYVSCGYCGNESRDFEYLESAIENWNANNPLPFRDESTHYRESEPKLQPCPFCGSSNVILDIDRSRNVDYVFCRHCHARGPEAGFGKNNAVEQWNYVPRKTTEDRVTVVELEEMENRVFPPRSDVLRLGAEIRRLREMIELIAPVGSDEIKYIRDTE